MLRVDRCSQCGGGLSEGIDEEGRLYLFCEDCGARFWVQTRSDRLPSKPNGDK